MIDLSRYKTPQAVVDTVVKGLADQGWQRATYNGFCMYRGPNSLKCAAGQLLTDEEAAYVGPTSWGGVIDNGRATNVHRQLICELQRAHDCASDSEGMKRELRTVIRKHNLEIPPELHSQ